MIYISLRDGVIDNFVEATEECAKARGYVPWYQGAKVGNPYMPEPAPEPEPTAGELMDILLGVTSNG